MTGAAPTASRRRGETIEQRLRRVIMAHFDPLTGSPYWLERASELGIDPIGEVERLEDLAMFGPMSPADLRARPLKDYIPRRFHSRLDRFIVGQTGGATGEGTWTAYRTDEFDEAFVLPFVAAAEHVGFRGEGAWLYVGPSGPHIIGKVVRHLANALGAADPFSVDFDPRWARKLPDDSVARRRYLRHVVEQSMGVIDRQPIGVLFTTPPVLAQLAEEMTAPQRERIRGVHYGGMALEGAMLERFQREMFPRAVHLSGYGNTLFGCCLELSAEAGRSPRYYPHGVRLHFEVVDDAGVPAASGARGRVRFTRLDESCLIVRMLERDEAAVAELPAGAPHDFTLPGLENPHTAPAVASQVAAGLY